MAGPPFTCESFDAALASSAVLLEVGCDFLLNRLQSFDLNRVSNADQRHYPCEDLLAQHVGGVVVHQLPRPAVTHWYHATRVTRTTDFAEGILPLSAMLDRIWHFLGDLASDWSTPDQWRYFRANMRGRGGRQYASKFASAVGEGPFGFLIRAAIFRHREMGNHDYLGIPEIVEDICLSYEETCGHRLAPRYLDATVPSIVTFRSKLSESVLGPALMYLYRALRGEKLSIACNTCYAGHGVAVPASAIVNIERDRNLKA